MALISEEDLKELQKKIDRSQQGRERIDPAEIRWRFWAYACPYLRRAHRLGELFRDPELVEEKQMTNTIVQKLDPEGVTMALIISSTSSMVELRFDESSRIASALFEHMYRNRQAINEVLGFTLHYANANPRKDQPPRVYISNAEAEILKVSDWQLITRFFVDTTMAIERLFDIFFIVC